MGETDSGAAGIGGRVAPIGPRVVAVIIIVALLVLIVVVTRTASSRREAGARLSDSHSLNVGASGCARGIGSAPAGRVSYPIVNQSSTPQEITIYDQQHRYAYGAIEMLAPGASRTLVTVLPAGSYSLACEGDDGIVGYSDPFTVRGGPVEGVHRWIPADYGDLANAVSRYRRSVSHGLRTLAADTDRLLRAVQDHDRQLARTRWLVAHLDYQRLGAAYDTFGDDADKIDGRPDGLPDGVDDAGFSGFHRVEYLLWHGGSAAEVLTATRRLDDDVHGLVVDFPHQITQPNDVALRTHEVLENTMQFVLTGADDQGSNSGLATLAADIDGTRMTLSALRPVLRRNDPTLLAAVTRSLDELDALVTRARSAAHTDAVGALSGTARERLNGAVGDTLETLAPIPTELEILTTQDNG
ncbi:peptidase M75 family protein [Microlunatus soli]|uniref:Iron uptake system EfeUOB, component EfeO/EfeM n=1 Tax=Microlunatus soli TaxID=630515 RepID=A0A1H2ANK9_9ACTN|nr:peptidase M75 family protein [Microlunatus soli]SDT47501.1 Iron uptake system EfeUOB, component EfeO/EfeM [Microlunatus soli]